MIKAKTVLATALLFLTLGCAVTMPSATAPSKPTPIEGGALVPKASNTVFTLCGLPMVLIIQRANGIEVYAGPNILKKAKSIDPHVPLVIADITKSWNGTSYGIECPPPPSDMKTPKKKKPREWYANF